MNATNTHPTATLSIGDLSPNTDSMAGCQKCSRCGSRFYGGQCSACGYARSTKPANVLAIILALMKRRHRRELSKLEPAPEAA